MTGKPVRKTTIAAVAGAVALIIVASCVPSVDPSGYGDETPNLTGPGIVVTVMPAGSSGGGPSPSLTPPQINAAVNYYELAVRKVNAAGTWEYRRTAARRGGTLAVAVDPGYRYDVLLLGGFLPGEGKSPILLQSAFATTPVIGNTAYPQPMVPTDIDIDASLYEVTLKSSIPGSPAPGDERKPFRTGGATGVMELDLPKWETPSPANGIDHWLSDGAAKVTVKGIAPLIRAYNAASGGNSGDGHFTAATVPAYGAAGFFDPDPSFLPHLSLVAFLDGETDSLYPLHTPWSLDLPATWTLPAGGAPVTDGRIDLQWNGIEAHADDVWTPYDTDGKLYWDAYYRAFSSSDPATGFDRWRIQNGLDNSIDGIDGAAGNTGGAVYVKIGAGGGARFGEGGKLVVGIGKAVPGVWNAVSATALSSEIVDIAYGNGKFVAIGMNDTTAAWSHDGVVWTAGTTIFPGGGRKIAFGGGKFVIIGANAAFGHSADGAVWTLIPSGSNGSLGTILSPVAYGNGNFVAGGRGGRLAWSDDGGATWHAATSSVFAIGSSSSYDFNFFADPIIYADGKFVGGGPQGRLGYSANGGRNWATTGTGGFGTNTVMSIAYGGGTGAERFVAIGAAGTIAWSHDGMTWTQVASADKPAGFDGMYRSIVYAKGKFVAVGVDGIAWSYDGTVWTAATPAVANVRTVAYGGECYVAGTADGKILYSRDGKIWTTIPAGAGTGHSTFTGQIDRFVYAQDKWVAVGTAGKMAWCVPE
jgi:hypothetical protein